MLKQTGKIDEEIRKSGADAYPDECCGILFGTEDGADHAVKALKPIGNARESGEQYHRFLIPGTHEGFWNYTIGQRKGLGIASKTPLCVLELNACRNEVVVGRVCDTLRRESKLENCTWIAEEPEGALKVKVRSAAKPVPAYCKKGSLYSPCGISAFAPGQSAVLYRGEEVLGGGIIAETL